MNESFEQMVRSLHTKMPMATQEDAIAFATRIRDELCKGQEPVNCDLASTFGNFCQCKNHKLYLHPAPIPADVELRDGPAASSPEAPLERRVGPGAQEE